MSRTYTVGLLVDAEGHVDRPVDLEGWWTRGRGTATNGLVEFETAVVHGVPPDDRSRFVVSGDGLLEGFCALAAASNGTIARFAGKWGPLGLCWHGLPGDHPVGPADGPKLARGACYDPHDPEPIEYWRYWAARAASIGTIAAAVVNGSVGPACEWRVLERDVPWVDHVLGTRDEVSGPLPELDADPDPEVEARLELDRALLGFHPGTLGDTKLRTLAEAGLDSRLSYARSRLASTVDHWLAFGRVRTTITWMADRPELSHRSSGLFGAIGVQLLLAIAARGLALCVNCGRGFTPSRRPNPNRRTWCGRSACQKASHAAAQRDSRARRRGPSGASAR